MFYTLCWWFPIVLIVFTVYPVSADLFNSLPPSDAIGRQRSGSTLAQVMACCLMTPSHYLNQCWLIISKVEWHSSKGKFTRDTPAINHWNYLENLIPKISFKFPRGQWVNSLPPSDAIGPAKWPMAADDLVTRRARASVGMEVLICRDNSIDCKEGINSLSPERYGCNFKCVICQYILMNDILRISRENGLSWIPLMLSPHWFR